MRDEDESGRRRASETDASASMLSMLECAACNGLRTSNDDDDGQEHRKKRRREESTGAAKKFQ